jgi:hypothetical protein
VRLDATELMHGYAATRGVRADHLWLIGHSVRGARLAPLEANVCGENSVTASRGIRSPDAPARRKGNYHALDYSQSIFRSRVASWSNHDRVRADFIGRGGSGLHWVSDHGWRYLEPTRRCRHQPLIAAGRTQEVSRFLPDYHSLATRGSLYELDDQDHHQGQEPPRSDHDRVRAASGHRRCHRRFVVSDLRDHPSRAREFDRRRDVSRGDPAPICASGGQFNFVNFVNFARTSAIHRARAGRAGAVFQTGASRGIRSG